MAKVKSNRDDNFEQKSKAGRTALIRSEEDLLPPTDNIVRQKDRTSPRLSNRRLVKRLNIKATRQQLPLSRRIAKSLLNEESKDIVSYIVYDILIPAAKSMITESIQSGIEMMLYGEAGQRRKPSRNQATPRVSYGNFYQRDDRRPERPQKRFAKSRFNLDEIVFKDGSEASDVLAALCDHLEEYGGVSVAEFYDYAGVEGASHTDHNWGWEGSELSDAYCTHTRGGYVIVLPEPKELE